MESKLVTANSWFGAMSKGPMKMTFKNYRETNLRRMRERFKIKEAGFDGESEPVQAFVNHGRWVAICPNHNKAEGRCRGAELAWEEGWFFCCSCLNSSVGHKYRRLVFPENWADIEDALIIRPLSNRNWNLGETVEALLRENEEHAAELLTAAEGG